MKRQNTSTTCFRFSWLRATTVALVWTVSPALIRLPNISNALAQTVTSVSELSDSRYSMQTAQQQPGIVRDPETDSLSAEAGQYLQFL